MQNNFYYFLLKKTIYCEKVKKYEIYRYDFFNIDSSPLLLVKSTNSSICSTKRISFTNKSYPFNLLNNKSDIYYFNGLPVETFL